MLNRNDGPCLTDNFIDKWGNRIKPELRFKGRTEREFFAWKEILVKKIKELLGELPSPAEMAPVRLFAEEKEKYTREKWMIQTERDCWMPLYILVPRGSKKKYPAILCCHGHGSYGKDPVAGVHNNNPAIIKEIEGNYNYGELMAERGFITACPDWRSFGERIDYGKTNVCNHHFLQHLVMGRTLLGANIFDGMRTIDFLLARDDVDGERIGCMGLSFGGTMTTYLTLLDDRIKAGDIICYATTTLHYAISKLNTCGSQIVPFLYRYADVGDVIAAICPKPLHIESGLTDECFRIHSALEAHGIVKKAYAAAGVSSKLTIEVFNGGHQFAAKEGFKFFEENLGQY